MQNDRYKPTTENLRISISSILFIIRIDYLKKGWEKMGLSL